MGFLAHVIDHLSGVKASLYDRNSSVLCSMLSCTYGGRNQSGNKNQQQSFYSIMHSVKMPAEYVGATYIHELARWGFASLHKMRRMELGSTAAYTT